MSTYLDYQFTDTPEAVSTFDELPLWSAPFGLLLLKHIDMKPGITMLDIGSGAGFPLLEIAQRLGPSCRCYGIDPWTNANNRAREKMRNYGVNNVTIIEGSAEALPFEQESIDLIISNLGINNFTDPALVLKESYRVLASGGKLALTTNLSGHWREFYQVFEETLRYFKRPGLLTRLKQHEAHCGTTDSISKMFTNNGFTITRCITESFEMRFLDGSAFLRHSFIKMGWLASWKSLVPDDIQKSFFDLLEHNLNVAAAKAAGLTLTIPMAFIEGQKDSGM